LHRRKPGGADEVSFIRAAFFDVLFLLVRGKKFPYILPRVPGAAAFSRPAPLDKRRELFYDNHILSKIEEKKRRKEE
jgi:hypothetical protein